MPAATGPSATPETELKFSLGEGGLRSLTAHPILAGPARSSRLRSVYYDTPEHHLRNNGLSLRVRERDGGFLQTVKRRSGQGVFDRDEWEAPVAANSPDLALLASTPAAEALNGSAGRLAPVFETRIERTVRLWEDGGSVVEVAVDTGEVVAGDRSEPVEELELELRSGDPKALFDLAGALAGAAAMTLSFESKAERGYRLSGYDGAAAIKAERTSITPRTTAEAAFRQIARSALSQISGNAELLGSVSSPQIVHQTRVGLRRLRAGLSIFARMLDAEGLAHAKAELRWLAAELDAARDIDVFAETFLPRGDGAPDDPDLAALLRRVQIAQAQAHERAAAAIASPRFAALLLDIAAWVEVGGWTRSDDKHLGILRRAPMSAFGVATLDHLRRRVRRMARGLAEQDAEARHELRLKVKKLRYAIEFFASAVDIAPNRRRRYLEAAKLLQDHLGALNDLAMARTTALAVVGGRASELAFTAGQLVAERLRLEPQLVRQAEEAFQVLDDATPFWRRKARRG